MSAHVDPSDEAEHISRRARLDALVEQHPIVDRLFRAGWLARGVVYTTVGLTAIPVALQQAPRSSDASPTGALGRIADLPGGRVLLGALVVGMVLYVMFQLMSLALIRGTGFFRWWRRAGHLVASVLYSLFTWSAAEVALSGDRPNRSSLLERVSRAVLENTGGRWLVGVAGLVTMGVAGYFAHRHVVQRGFADGLSDIESAPTDNGVRAGTIVVLGMVGWIGRSTVISLIGFFVLRAAMTFDPREARGFDRALRATAGSTVGSILVLLAALGLLAYGVFCIVSHRARTIHDIESELEAAESP
ncbi:DUF1206 domain-containing protein [Ilumatobacter sp.]|uniref:DUF1206 domain-containing protein n=1 Tax=Ilumatobacter sp. TaxID=1967498 RepID=UPI003B51D19B